MTPPVMPWTSPGRILPLLLAAWLGATLAPARADTGFIDVPPDSWVARYIAAIAAAGITTGCGGGRYCPLDPVTREQMAAFLVRFLEGEPPVNYCAGTAPFADVDPAAWSCGYIKALAEVRLTTGCGGGRYCPSDPVTREQMAAFLIRALEGEPPGITCAGSSPFSDVDPASWSCGYIKRLVELGVTTGCGGGNYCPEALVTREQMAAFLARAFLFGGTHPLNDTGITLCGDASSNDLPCPVADFPEQDAETGRDVTHNDDSDGHAGFSFTKLDASGYTLPASAPAWSCVRDNVTGLIWEVKTDDGGLRDMDNTYTWYNPDPATNGGNPGTQNGGTCTGSDCDTHAFVQAVNAQGLCGAKDWRLPSRFELMSIVSNDRYSPAIESSWFPNTSTDWTWSSSPFAGNLYHAWSVPFRDGDVLFNGKDDGSPVRLVRAGQ